MQGIEEFINMAIEREERAYSYFRDAKDRMEFDGTKKLLDELAKEELRHKSMLKKALEEGVVEHIGKDVEPMDLKLSDTLVAPQLTDRSTPQDLLIVAMKMEDASAEFYRSMQPYFKGSGFEELIERLVREEMKHKERLEKDYDEHYLTEM